MLKTLPIKQSNHTLESKEVNWTNLLFLTLTALSGIFGTLWVCLMGMVSWKTVVLAGVLMAFSGLSITCGYHRLFSHCAYKAHWLPQLFFAVFGAGAFEGSILEWSSDHRLHHRFTDTDKDPYNAKRGFWFSHVGWLIYLDPKKRTFKNVDDLLENPLVVWQHRYFIPLAFLTGFVLPTALAALWGEALAGLFLAGAFRVALNLNFTFCINSVCHIFGRFTYSDRDSARDHWLTALFTYGEGYHNFHHRFPVDYRNGIRLYDFDPSKWLIVLLSFLGLASDLKSVSRQRIVQAQLSMAESKIKRDLDRKDSAFILPLLGQARETVLRALAKAEQLEKAYHDFKLSRLKDASVTWKDYRSYLRQSQKEIKLSLKAWSAIVLYALKHQPLAKEVVSD